MHIPFVHLHCHSHYSLLDGAAKLDKLVGRAKDIGMPALALTDHGNLYGTLEFYNEAMRGGIKPILGYEAYVAPGSRFDKSASSAKDTNHHLTLLAMNPTGYRHLIKLSSLAFSEGFYYKPRIDKEVLRQYNEGLICLSGCASSEFSQNILRGDSDRYAAAKEVAVWHQELFGDRYYIEIQDNGLEIQKIILAEAVKIARELGIPTIATNDVHYVYEKDAEAQDILLCVSTKAFRTDQKRMRMGSDQFFLRSGREMLQAMPGQEDAIRRTLEIADRIDCDLGLGKLHFPPFTPPQGLTADDYLRKLCIDGLKNRYSDSPKRLKNGELSTEVMERLNRELGVIAEKKLANYFLIVWDFVRFAEERGIHRTARGSGVGALVCYALNMSHVCPLEFDLLFERFLDVERAALPDIDIDFDQDRRTEVLDYVKQKYGDDSVAQIGTFQTMAAKGAIKDVGRVLNHTIPAVESVTKLVPDDPKMTIAKALQESDELSKRYATEQEIAELIDFAKLLEGQVRNPGVHACAVVIADKPLTEYLPLQRVKENPAAVTQWEGPMVEKAGLLKMDFLGLRNLTVLALAIEIIKQTTGKTIDPYRFPLDDEKAFDLLCRGETKGVFQLESGGMRELTQRMKPTNFRDIIAILALYRPGTLKDGIHNQYVEVKHGRKRAEYAHPVLEEILSETYGFIVYQEQIMRILNRLGNISLSSSYACIKAISKKDDAKIAGYREQFINGTQKNGLTKKKGEEIFDLIFNFAGYGFNKSHSTAYALIAYMEAYLKAHYPVEFMTALLCGDISERNFTKKDSTVEHIEDCQRMNITIIQPDVNYSDRLYSVKDGQILFALSAISGCGDWASDKIIAARNAGGPFKNLFDFCERVDSRACPKAAVEKLIKAGAFDSLGCHRSQLMQVLDSAFKVGQRVAEDQNMGQKNLFAAAVDDEPAQTATKKATVGLPEIPEWSAKEKAEYERETLGYYVSWHPLKEMEPLFQTFRTCTCHAARVLPDKKSIILAGMIGEIKVAAINKDPGKPGQYANFTLEDVDGNIRSIIWPEQYEIYRELVKPESVVFAVGKTNRKKSQDETSDDGNFVIDALYTVEDGPQALSRGIGITLDETRHGIDGVTKLYEILRGYPGRSDVELSVRLSNGSLALFRPSKLRIELNPEMRRRVAELVGNESLRLLKAPLKQPEERYRGRR